MDAHRREGEKLKKFGHKNAMIHEKREPQAFLITPSTSL
jgi:hypothetical protein